MLQVYCNDEKGINKWLQEKFNLVEVIDIKFSMNQDGEYIMVIYKELEGEFNE